MSAFVSNEEYMQRWEDAAPKAVDSRPNLEQIKKFQGTRNRDESPDKSYMVEEQLTPEMEAAVAAYAENVHNDSSNQTKEELARWKEGNQEVAKEYQFVAPDEYNNVEERMGRILHSSEFINILRDKVGLKCWYRAHPHADKLTLLVQKSFGVEKPEIACWVQNGFAPELSIVRFDDHGVPLNESHRGWRTCILQMILKGMITEEQANKYFGPPKQTEAYARYNSTLHSFRNRDRKV
jgi:hypothetical protein